MEGTIEGSTRGERIQAFMRLAWRMGRVAGIDLYIHATFLLVFLYVPKMVANGMHPIEAILLICAVFGCVLLHELGHALMARRFGIGTVDITLYPIGGVARLERMPRAPGTELLIALAGPAVNFAIAAGIGGLIVAGAATLGLTGGMLSSFFFELLVINLALGLFNLIPAFPMDGGRVLRAILSTSVGRVKATRAASMVGQVLAVVFVIWGFSTSSGNPIHLALAAFIFIAARSEEAHVLHEERRRSMSKADAQGMWVAPPGYRWVDRGNGLWQLAPMGVNFADPAAQDASAWR
jgi:Zn-dependent protease